MISAHVPVPASASSSGLGRRSRVLAHPNIALVKYWGKRNVDLNLPAVGSISITLDTFETQTLVQCDRNLITDEISLGKKRLHGGSIARHSRVLERLRARCACPHRVRVSSVNNFPTGAGLASSASGFAAFTVAAAEALEVALTPEEMGAIAREGSGSAPRSLLGGFVEMARGVKADGSDSYASSLCSADYFPLKVVVAIVETGPKAILSTEGMNLTQKTSPYWKSWLDAHPADLESAREALTNRDFARLAEVSEHSCLKMHALMMVARPSLRYWLPPTYAALHEISALRARGVGCFFTIDAGPQVKAVCLPESVIQVENAMRDIPGVKQIVTVSLGGPARSLTL